MNLFKAALDNFVHLQPENDSESRVFLYVLTSRSTIQVMQF